MVLEANHAAACQAVFGCHLPLAAVLAGKPIIGPCLKFKYLFAIEIVLYVAVIEHYARIVPFALLIYFLFVGVGQIHCIVHTEFLPLFEFCGCIGLFPTFFIDELIFRTGNIRHLEVGVLLHMIEHATVAAV